MEYKNIIYQPKDGVAWLTINRPESFNSCNQATLNEMLFALEEARADQEIGVVVLTGAGDKSFCSGGSLELAGEINPADMRHYIHVHIHRWLQVFTAIRTIVKPVIAAINGYAVGGGNELVVVCDLAIASERARFGQVGPKMGASPILSGNNFLQMSIGEKKAKEVCFLTRQYTAEEAERLGWINKVVPHDQLYAEVEKWCQDLLNQSPLYLGITKVSSNAFWDLMYTAYTHGIQMVASAGGSEEQMEGARSFVEKRKPDFRQFRKKGGLSLPPLGGS